MSDYAWLVEEEKEKDSEKSSSKNTDKKDSKDDDVKLRDIDATTLSIFQRAHSMFPTAKNEIEALVKLIQYELVKDDEEMQELKNELDSKLKDVERLKNKEQSDIKGVKNLLKQDDVELDYIHSELAAIKQFLSNVEQRLSQRNQQKESKDTGDRYLFLELTENLADLSNKYFFLRDDIKEGVGRITKYNQTADVGPNEIKKQASKYGFDVNKDGYPPLLTSTNKNKKKRRQKTADPNTMWNLGLVETKDILKEKIEIAYLPYGNEVRVYINPIPKQVEKILKEREGLFGVRGLYDKNNNTIYLWNAYNAIHYDIMNALGIIKHDVLEFYIHKKSDRYYFGPDEIFHYPKLEKILMNYSSYINTGSSVSESYTFLRDGIEKPKKHRIDLSFYGTWFNPKEGLILNVEDYQHAAAMYEYLSTQGLEGKSELTPDELEEKFHDDDIVEYAINAGFVRLVHENNETNIAGESNNYFIIQGNLENVRNGWHLIRKALGEHNPKRLMIEVYEPYHWVDIWNDTGPVSKSKKYNTFVRKYIKNIKEDITEDLEGSTYGSWYNSYNGNVIPVLGYQHKEAMEEYLLNKRILDEDDEIVIIGDDVYDLNIIGIYGAAFMLGFVRLVHSGVYKDNLEIHGKVKDIKRSWKAFYNFIRANNFNRIVIDFTDSSNWLNAVKDEEEEWKNNREFQNINKFMKGKVSEDYNFIRENQLEELGLHSKFWYNTFTKKTINVEKNEHHSHTIINNPELFGLEISPDRPKRLYDANLVKKATEQGWARCVYHKQRFDVEAFNIKETRRATKFVLDNGLSINNLHVETTSDGAYYKITSEINVEKFVKTGKTSFVESKLLKEYVINSEIDTSHYGSWYNPKENVVLPVDFQEHADTIQEYLRGENLYRREPDKEYNELFVNGEWIKAPGSQYTRGFALGFVRLLHYKGAFEIRGKYEDVALAWKALRKTIRAGDYNSIAIDMDDQWALIRKKEYERWSDKKAFKVLNKKLISGENIKDVMYITENVISEQDYKLPYKFWMDPYENRIIPVLSPYVHHQSMAINELDNFDLPKEDEQHIYELATDINDEANETYHPEIMYLIMRNGWVRGISEGDRAVSLEYQDPKDARKALAAIMKRGVDLERAYIDRRSKPTTVFPETKILSDLEIDRFIRYGKLNEGVEYVETSFDRYPVYTNPSPNLLAKMLDAGKSVRGLMLNDKIYLWDAYNATHHSTIHNLGLSDNMDDIVLLMFFNAKERDLDAHVLLAELGFSGDFVTKEIYNSPVIKRLISKTEIPVKYKRMGRLLDESVKPYRTSDDHTIMMLKNPTISNLRNFILNLSKKEKDIVEDDFAEVRGIVHDGNVYFTNPIRADHRDMFDALFVNMTHDMWRKQTFYVLLNLKTNALYFTSIDTDGEPQKYTNVMLRDKLKALRKKYLNEAVEKATTTSGIEITVYRNPTSRAVEKLLKEYTGTRGLYADGNIWLWDAYDATHYDIQRALGISNAVQLYITFGNRGKPYGIGITKGKVDINLNELLEFPRIQKAFSRVNLQPIKGNVLDESLFDRHKKYWYNTKTKEVIKLASSRNHHTEYIIKNPEKFGLTKEEVNIETDTIYNTKLLLKVMTDGWTRVNYLPPDLVIEGATKRLTQKTAKYFIENGFDVERLVVDIRDTEDTIINQLTNKHMFKGDENIDAFIKYGRTMRDKLDMMVKQRTNENVQWATGENLEHAKGWSQKDQLSGKYDVVWVDIEELFNRTDPGERLDIHHELGGKHHIGDRVARAKEFWQAGKYMDPSTISVMPGGTVRFGDGRHRLVAAYQLGEKYAPVIVPKNEVKYLEGTLKENIELGPEHLEEIEGWWITPDGDIFDTEDYMGAHAMSIVHWALENRESMFNAFEQMAHNAGYYDDYYHPENNEVADGSKGDIMEYASNFEFDVSDFAKDRGFIRVVSYKKIMEFDITNPSKEALSTALKFAKMNEHLFNEYTLHTTQDYKNYDSFKDFKRAVNRFQASGRLTESSYSFLREGINVDDLSADVYGFWVNVKTGQIIPVQDDFHHEKTMRAYTKKLGLSIPHDKIYQWAYDNDFVRLTKRAPNLYVQGTFKNVRDFWNKALRKVYNDYNRIAFDLYKHNPGHYVLHTDDRQEFNDFIRLMKTGKVE